MKPNIFLTCVLAVVAIAGCNPRKGDAATNTAVKVAPGKTAKQRDWAQVVTATAAGGFVMGKPQAKVKLIEFGSMTCPHCAAFDEEGAPRLLDYVKTGQVSWEFRNYVRDAFDVTASLIARCNGAKGFFPLTRALFHDQKNWEARIDAAPQDQLKSAQDLPPDRQFVTLAKIGGLQQFAAAHGLPSAKANQCLTDAGSVDKLVQMANDATTQFPGFPGTPTFVINGTMLESTATWDALEPQLKNALGERG